MSDFSHPFLIINRLLKEYHQLCNAMDFTRAYEVAVDISEMASLLEKIAQENAQVDL